MKGSVISWAMMPKITIEPRHIRRITIVLAASLSIHRDGQDSARVTAVANARRRAAGAEPWLTILPAAAHLELVGRAGWQADEAADAAQFGTGAEPGRSLLVTARPASGCW